MSRTINDWAPETRALLRALITAGFKITKGHNGEYAFEFELENKFIENLTACDESHLYVEKGGVCLWLFLVYGNSPGELVCDYSIAKGGADPLEPVVTAHYEAWSGRKQPTKLSR